MSNTEIQEGNKLIAEFMGGKHNGGSYYDFYEGLQIQGFSDGKRPASWSEATLKYHSSWDWLMPVVEKINNWNDEKSDDYFELLLDCEFDPLRILDLKITNPIKFIWQAVIDFIQWYNQNKKP